MVMTHKKSSEPLIKTSRGQYLEYNLDVLKAYLHHIPHLKS